MIKKRKSTKYERNINFTKSIAILKTRFVELLHAKDLKGIVEPMLELMANFTSVVRPDRSFSRKQSGRKHSVHYRRNICLS